jgi:hypothetical protein
MKHALLCMLLLLTGCHVSAIRPAQVLAQPYTYWYSAQQREALDNLLDGPMGVQPHYFVMINGQSREYTECQKANIREPYGRFSDYQKVGTVAGQPCQAW